MTLDEIRAQDKEMLTPAQAAAIIGCDPHYIRLAARDDPDILGFPIIRVGNRTKIPRRAFIAFCEGRRLEG